MHTMYGVLRKPWPYSGSLISVPKYRKGATKPMARQFSIGSVVSRKSVKVLEINMTISNLE